MPVTFNDVIRDIKAGKSRQIYFSSKSLWWTHLESDLEEASQLGIKYKSAIAQSKGQILFVCNGYPQTDPIGEPVKIFPKPAVWMNNSKKFTASFGRHGLRAFMKAHHQNCSTYFSNKWADYNQLIDSERGKPRG